MKTKECYQRLRQLLGSGDQAVTATVVESKGSTPREPGAKMLIRSDGTTEGTIGGGCGEADVIEVARRMLDRGEKGIRMVQVDLTEDVLEASDRICGGIMEIAVECWTHQVRGLDLLTGDSSPSAVRVLPVSDSTASDLMIFTPERSTDDQIIDDNCEQALQTTMSHSTSLQSPEGDRTFFFEYVAGEHTLLICGAGHIAQPLSQLGKLLDYRIVVVDDRPEYASSERFPHADLVLAEPFERALDGIEIDRNTAAVMVTRGHRYDEFCLRLLLNSKVGYLGVLGSRRRVRAVFHDLLEDGYTEEQLQKIFAPIGIDIGAQTPSEIAVSIMAELVSLKRGQLGGHMKTNIPSPRRQVKSRKLS